MTEVVAALIWKNNNFMICQRPKTRQEDFFGSLLAARLNWEKQKNRLLFVSVKKN